MIFPALTKNDEMYKIGELVIFIISDRRRCSASASNSFVVRCDFQADIRLKLYSSTICWSLITTKPLPRNLWITQGSYIAFGLNGFFWPNSCGRQNIYHRFCRRKIWNVFVMFVFCISNIYISILKMFYILDFIMLSC